MLKRLISLIVPIVLVVGLGMAVSPAEANHHGEGYEQPGGWNAIRLDPAGNAMVHDCGPIKWAFHPWGEAAFNNVVIWVMAEVDSIIPRQLIQTSWDQADIRIQKWWPAGGPIASGYTSIHSDGWRFTYNESLVNPTVQQQNWGHVTRHEVMHAFGGHHNNTPNSILRIGWSYPNFGWPDMAALQDMTNEWRCFHP